MLKESIHLELRKASQESTPILSRTFEIEKDVWSLHSNYFAIVWIKEGSGTVETEITRSAYNENMVLCFNTYQAFILYPTQKTVVTLLLFHANFFCIETYHHEVGCNGVLFNNVYSTSQISIPQNKVDNLATLINDIENEIDEQNLAADELVFSYLKILLVKLTRLKSASEKEPTLQVGALPSYLEELKLLIEENFRTEHQATFYANKLNITLKALSKSTKRYCGKPLSSLIKEKLILNAKWTLLHTNKPVKEVAADLGFDDEYYFSRFFKKHIGLSPKQFRDEEWAMRKGYLSIT